MGFKSPMDRYSIQHQLHMVGVEMNSPHNDGYTTWEIKKDLYRIKFLVDQIIASSSSYVGEEEWLDEESKKVAFELR
jgi:hypothetical protein